MPRRRKTPKEVAEERAQSSQAPPQAPRAQPPQGRGQAPPSGHQAAQPAAGRGQQVFQAAPPAPPVSPGSSSGPGFPQPRDGRGGGRGAVQGRGRGRGPTPPSHPPGGMAIGQTFTPAPLMPTPDLPQAPTQTFSPPYNIPVGEQAVQFLPPSFGGISPVQGVSPRHLLPVQAPPSYMGLQQQAPQPVGLPPASYIATQPIGQTISPVLVQTDAPSTSSAVGITEQFQMVGIQGPPASPPLEQAPIVPVSSVPASSKSMRFPSRPGKGQSGTKCIVKANHFFAALPDKDLHQYDVSISPEVTSRGVNRAVMEQLVKLHRQTALDHRLPAYDGRKSLYTAGPLPFQSKDFSINLLDEDDGSGTARRERNFKVVIKFAARADLHHLGEFLSGRQPDAPQEALQVLDIVLRELPTHRFCPVGRSFYSPDLGRRQQLGEGLESWRGFYQSIRPTQMGLSLNIDMSSTAFIEPLPVVEFVAQLLGKDVSRHLSDQDRIKIKKALRGVKIEVTHRGNMRRKYRISGLTSQPTQELTFPVDDKGTMKSVVEYFQETYGYAIRNTALPCLQVGNQQRPNYLPMEVCKIVEGQRYSKRLNEKQITALLKVTCQRPMERERDILEVFLKGSFLLTVRDFSLQVFIVELHFIEAVRNSVLNCIIVHVMGMLSVEE